MSNEQLKELIEMQLEMVDDWYAEQGISVNQRLLKATILIAGNCISSESTPESTNVVDKPWFPVVFELVEYWYKDRYGEDYFNQDNREFRSGIVTIYNNPFEVRIPLTIFKPEEVGKTVWITFPNEVLDEEEPLDWIQNKPNLNRLNDDQLDCLEKDIIEVSSSIRNIHMGLISADFTEPPNTTLAGSIQTHLSHAATNILQSRTEDLSLSFWECHLAVEKVIKLYLRQKNLSPPNTHDLNKLRRLTEQHIQSGVLDEQFSRLVSDKDAIKYRYGEHEDVTLAHAIGNYRDTLKIVEFFAEALNRKRDLNNLSMLVKILPWMQKG
jgi:HEPN domain-containing protein